MKHQGRGSLIVISGPSGTGKSTVVKQLLQQSTMPLELSISATTRQPRPGEKNGVDYHFLSPGEFERQRDRGDFLECFEVFQTGFWYGTFREAVTTSLEKGKWVTLEIDVDGALAVMEQYPEAITIFVRPPSMEELERRLRGRGTENDEKIRRRLDVARREMTLVDRYRHDVVNDTVDRTVQEICDLLETYECVRK